ncbi:MAG: methyltransferase domain-containing protein [Nitrospirales bacterium]
MLSTLSPAHSNLMDHHQSSKSVQRGKKKSFSIPGYQLPVAIEGSGASWEGLTKTVTRSSLSIVIEGCPLVVNSQSIELQVVSPQFSFEMCGLIEKIIPLGGDVTGRWSRVQLDVSYDPLDDLKWQRFKIVLQDATTLISSSYLKGTLVPIDLGDCLWKMKPESPATHLVSSDNSLLPGVEKIFEHIAQSPTNLRVELETPIVSVPVEFPNQYGQIIRAYYDAPESPLPIDSPVIVLSPGYGETKREYITLAYYLASNGFHVLRYDHTNHVGVSDGEHVHTTLSLMRGDLGTVIKYVENQWPTSPRGIIATSLSGRVAIKAVANNDVNVDFLYLITPIVNVRQTLQAVHQEDLIATYQNRKQKGVTNVLGFNVELDHWLADAVHGEYSDLESTYRDISRIQSPVTIVSAEHDAWVQMSNTKTVIEAFGQYLQQWMVIPRGLHRVLESPKQAKAVYRELVRLAQVECVIEVPATLQEPTRKAIGRQNKVERDARKTEEQPVELSGFWKDYLDHFHYIVNFSDYQQLLDHISRLLGPVKSGEKVLDAGCGNGNLGSFLLQKYQASTTPRQKREGESFEYVGIDFVPTALKHARERYQGSLMSTKSCDLQKDDHSNSTYAFHCVDLNKPLPFKDGTFDKVTSNLVLGYLESPANTIRELMRVLTPGGALVLTNLKPNSDLSRIFSNFVQETSNAQEIEEARQLLNNSGKIREAEGEGLFCFPDAEELKELISSASDGGETRIFSTFANQAYIVAVTKGVAQEYQHQYDRTDNTMLQAA